MSKQVYTNVEICTGIFHIEMLWKRLDEFSKKNVIYTLHACILLMTSEKQTVTSILFSMSVSVHILGILLQTHNVFIQQQNYQRITIRTNCMSVGTSF